MVSRLLAQLNQPDPPAVMPSGVADHFDQFPVRQVMGTGATDEQPVRREQARGEPVELIVSLQARFMIAFAFDQRGRVEHDNIKGPAGTLQLPQGFEGIGRNRLDADLIQRRVPLNQFNCGCRGIQAGDLAGTIFRSGNSPSPRVTEGVQHAGSGNVSRQPLAIIPLVEEPARLLARDELGLESELPFAQRHPFGYLALDFRGLERQSFELPKMVVGAEDDSTAAGKLLQQIEQWLLQLLNPGRGNLDGQVVTEPVDNQAGKPVGFAIDPAVAVVGVEPFPELEGRFEPGAQPAGVELSEWRSGNDPGGNQGAGIEVGTREETAAVIEQLDQLPGTRPLRARRRRLDLVTEHPFVTAQQPAFGTFPQFQRGG